MMHSACCVLPKELREDFQSRRKWRVPRFSRLKNRYDSLSEEITDDDDEKERSWSSSFLRPDPPGREAELEAAEPELLDSSASTASGDFSASCWAEVDFEHNGAVQVRRTVSSPSAPRSVPSGTVFISADENASAASRSIASGEEESFGLESNASLDDISLLRPFRRLRFADEVDGEQLEEVHEMILIEQDRKARRLRQVRRRIEI